MDADFQASNNNNNNNEFNRNAVPSMPSSPETIPAIDDVATSQEELLEDKPMEAPPMPWPPLPPWPSCSFDANVSGVDLEMASEIGRTTDYRDSVLKTPPGYPYPKTEIVPHENVDDDYDPMDFTRRMMEIHERDHTGPFASPPKPPTPPSTSSSSSLETPSTILIENVNLEKPSNPVLPDLAPTLNFEMSDETFEECLQDLSDILDADQHDIFTDIFS